MIFVIDLKYPCYKAGEGESICFTGKPLMTDEEVSKFMNSDSGKGLVYLNYFKQVEI